MRKIKTLLLFSMIVVASMGIGTSHADSCSGTDTGPRTAAGSSKSSCGDIHCGNTGTLPTGNPGGVRSYVNNTSEGPQAEACNDGGPGNTQGRLVLQTSTDPAHPGARLVLDTDDQQPFPAGYIIVQGSTDNPGVWCNREAKDGGTAEPVSTSDGMRHQWDNPGTQGGADANAAKCLPQN